jgi:hypothetical protein
MGKTGTSQSGSARRRWKRGLYPDFEKNPEPPEQLSFSELVKSVGRSCDTCEFNMGPGPVCAGNREHYGESISSVSKLYPSGCDEWEVSFACLW